MGTYYRFDLAVGFRFTSAGLLAKFGQFHPEVSTPEARWDPKTGKRLPDATVVSQPARWSYLLDGETFETANELMEALATQVDSYLRAVGWYGQGGLDYILGPSLPSSSGRALNSGNLECSGQALPLSELEKLRPELERIRSELEKLGLSCPEPEVTVTWSVS